MSNNANPKVTYVYHVEVTLWKDKFVGYFKNEFRIDDQSQVNILSFLMNFLEKPDVWNRYNNIRFREYSEEEIEDHSNVLGYHVLELRDIKGNIIEIRADEELEPYITGIRINYIEEKESEDNDK